ncbi:hypothetical protein [Streptomyces cyaneofuscatus]|uniref:hypothetical protein n=1 Tax=Streptomyces cyaneofuscatus TaxID=66883 RepID=UPI0033288D32
MTDLQIDGARDANYFFDTGSLDEPDHLIYHPIPAHGQVRFRITIPSRVQERLKGWSVSDDNRVQDFIVFIDLDSRYPCTFVIPQDPEGERLRPSGAMIIIREFLKEELGKLGDKATVRLTTMGPSPFHADFYVSEGEGGDPVEPNFSLTRKHGHGYSVWDFQFDGTSFDTPQQALVKILERCRSEFGSFYRIEASGLVELRTVKSFTKEVQEAVSSYRRKGVKNWLHRVIRMRGEIRDLALQLLTLQIDIAERRRSSSSLVDALRERNPTLLLEKELSDKSDYEYTEDLERYSEILKVLETQQTQTVQRITAFCVSLLGVVVGAVLTAVLRRSF